jgi:streptogramin lyase
VDRDGDGLIKTSRGLGDIRPWTNAAGADTHGGVTTADDECIINYTRVTGTGTRTVAVDANNDVWVGGYSNHAHEKLDGVTGQPVSGTQFNNGRGGYCAMMSPQKLR